MISRIKAIWKLIGFFVSLLVDFYFLIRSIEKRRNPEDVVLECNECKVNR